MTLKQELKDSETDSRRVFGIGIGAARIALLAQQVRALNLAAALSNEKKVTLSKKKEKNKPTEYHVAVLGGGIAGVTFLIGMKHLSPDCKLCLIERAPRVLHLQKHCKTRYVHPSIHMWPNTEDVDLQNSHFLPLANWRAGPAHEMADDVAAQWDEAKKSGTEVEELFNTNVTEIRDIGNKVVVECETRGLRRQIKADFVIDAMGAPPERSFAEEGTPQYWRLDDLEQLYSSTQNILICGTADGALTDLLRCRIKGFDHGKIITDLNKFWAVAEYADLLQDIRKIEEHVISDKNDDEINLELKDAYMALVDAKVDCSNVFQEKVGELLREDTRVVLQTRENPFTYKAQPILRLWLAILLRYDSDTILETRKIIHPIAKKDGKFCVRFPVDSTQKKTKPGETEYSPPDITDTTFFDRLLVRIGLEPREIYVKKGSPEGVAGKRQDLYKNSGMPTRHYGEMFGAARSAPVRITLTSSPANDRAFWTELYEELDLTSDENGKSIRIESVEIDGIRKMVSSRISLKGSRRVTLFGNNGVGKSVILECISLLGHLPVLNRKKPTNTEKSVTLGVIFGSEPLTITFYITGGQDLKKTLADPDVLSKHVFYVTKRGKAFTQLLEKLKYTYPKASGKRHTIFEDTPRKKDRKSEKNIFAPFVSYFNTDMYDWGFGMDVRESPKDLSTDLTTVFNRLPVQYRRKGGLFNQAIILKAWNFLVYGERDKNSLGYEDGKIYVGGYPRSNVSSGINHLFFLSTLLFATRATGSLFLLDEPELHLSPAAVGRLNSLLYVSAERADNQFIAASHHPFMFMEQGQNLRIELADTTQGQHAKQNSKIVELDEVWHFFSTSKIA